MNKLPDLIMKLGTAGGGIARKRNSTNTSSPRAHRPRVAPETPTFVPRVESHGYQVNQTAEGRSRSTLVPKIRFNTNKLCYKTSENWN